MVENQHGLGSILSFSAKSVNPKVLEALLVGREKIVNQLENRVKNISNDGLNHQVLIVGARGTGKTHMISVLHNRILPQITEGKIKVAYFAEEEYGIAGYLDFMVRILNAFIRWNEDDAEFLRSQLSVLQETPTSQQENTIKRIIREYIGKQPLLILAENFNDILDALKKDGQSKLRNWLQENDRISIIATSQALSDDIGKEDKPFYGFFDEINIKPLTLEESFELLKALAKIEKREDVIKHLKNKGKSQVMAINTLVKGNHRLLITFYEFLKSDVLSKLSVMFIKTLNDLKPYYETFIRYQQPQQQKIIRYLALAKTPKRGTEIARECFIDQKSLSKQMSELARKKLIDIITDPDDKRNKLYDISEPLLRISIEIGEHKEGISALFIDFLALYYNQTELKSQKTRFSQIYKKCIDPKEKLQYSFEISARERALKIQNQIQEEYISPKFEMFIDLLKSNKLKKAKDVLNSIPKTDQSSIYYYSKSIMHNLLDEFGEAKIQIQKAIDMEPKETIYWEQSGDISYDLGDFKDSLTLYDKAKNLTSEQGDIILKISKAQFKLQNFNEAFKIINELVQNYPKNENYLLSLSEFYLEQKEYDNCLKTLNITLQINPENEKAHDRIGNLYYLQEKYDDACNAYKKAISINDENEFNWLGLALCYYNLNKHEKAIVSGLKSLEINPLSLNSKFFLSKAYVESKKTNKAIPLLYQIVTEKDSDLDANHISYSIIQILKFDSKISLEDCQKLEKAIFEKFNNSKEVEISRILIKTFREVILEENKKALYNLPKEQREFFQKEILDYRNKNSN